VSEVILNEPRIRALVSQCEAARVAQYVRMSEQGQGSGGAVFSQGQVHFSDAKLQARVTREHPTRRPSISKPLVTTREENAAFVFAVDILPPKGRGFLRERVRRPFGGFLLLTAYFAVHFTG
jgi:hypothetical protein